MDRFITYVTTNYNYYNLLITDAAKYDCVFGCVIRCPTSDSIRRFDFFTFKMELASHKHVVVAARRRTN